MGMTASDAQDGSFSVRGFVRVDLVVDDIKLLFRRFAVMQYTQHICFEQSLIRNNVSNLV